MPRLGSRVRVPFSARLFFIINQDRFKFRAQVAELVDAHVSGACVSQRAGSSPVLGTIFKFDVGEVAELVDALL